MCHLHCACCRDGQLVQTTTDDPSLHQYTKSQCKKHVFYGTTIWLLTEIKSETKPCLLELYSVKQTAAFTNNS